ncbi:hypothetical protein A5698_09620 [Mycobacterium sp. E136]|uniref:hypothetical protein n=1 Tax=Mycobacterium sp. E136 TaxID=1834125 RepID=UPI000801CEAC|nr:hypothetical protein [Mycobacterium sp. E136]OBH00041.1 hypothetical protein A5698_09620 [Mycobacterium sp. E136]
MVLAATVIASLTVVGGAACGGSTEPSESPAAKADESTTAPPAEVAENKPKDEQQDSQPQFTGGVYGDPAAAIDHWEEQTESDCGLMATRMVIGEINGSAPTEREIIDLAAKTPSDCDPGQPVYDESVDPSDGGVGHGTCTTDLLLLLKHYGIEADYTNDETASKGGLATGMDALAGYLGDDRQAIVCVNSNTIWETDGDKTGCGHLVTVAAIDYDNDAVYLGDSGGDDTKGEHVTTDVFESAWAAGDHELVVTAPR